MRGSPMRGPMRRGRPVRGPMCGSPVRRPALRRRSGGLCTLWLHLLGLRGTLLDMVSDGLALRLLTAKRAARIVR